MGGKEIHRNGEIKKKKKNSFVPRTDDVGIII